MAWFAEISGVPWSQVIGVCLVSYALGCVTLGYYLVRFATGQDVRQMGSGSVGAKNVGRAIGLWGFAVTLAGDVMKGALAVWVAERVTAHDLVKISAMLAVVTGHIWPVPLRFRGGKGMATSAGVLMAFDPWVMLVLVAALLVLYAVFRNATLAGLAAFSLLPLVSGFLGYSALNILGLALLTALVLFAHRENLSDALAHLAAERQPKVGSRKLPSAAKPQPKPESRKP